MDMQRREIEINSIMTVDTGYGFKTAQITLVEATEMVGSFIVPKDTFGADNPPFDVLGASSNVELPAGTYELVLYKGKGWISAGGIEISGHAERIGDDAYLITGDCTVTIPEDDDLGDLG